MPDHSICVYGWFGCVRIISIVSDAPQRDPEILTRENAAEWDLNGIGDVMMTLVACMIVMKDGFDDNGPIP